ncbi:xylulokinase [Candidatus Merdisoma sp. HCP28S3_D10]|uniref:xylulokinase n=1 Tax=unclassified Candidatus Merdisoma TaxID=3099611 RepID=UPI003F88F106
MKYLLAHDLGTSGNKANLFSTDGVLVKSVVKQYPCHYFNDTWAEQDPENWFQAVCEGTRELIADINPSDIAGVSFSGQMMGITLLDKTGKLLRPAIIWADQRAVEEQRYISRQITDETYYAITGNRNTCTNSLHKLLWCKNNESVYSQINVVLNSKDYIAYRLTGSIATDYSDAGGTGAFDLRTFEWSEDILREVGIDPCLFPPVYPSTHMIGTITAEAARLTGLLEGTPVFCGCGDGVAASVGSGISQVGEGYCCLGSSAWISYLDDKPYFDPGQRTFNLAGIEKGKVFPVGTMQAAGLSYDWMKTELCAYETSVAEKEHLSAYSLINKQIVSSPAGANGLVYLPYLLGERAPWWNDKARGAFLGLTKEHTHADMLRSVMEGVTLNLALILNIFRENYPLSSLRVIGGGAKEPIWRQIMADIFNARIQKLNLVEEGCSLGAAVVAGIGAGILNDSRDIQHFLAIEETSEPNPQNTVLYQNTLKIFTQYYRALQPVFDQI